MKHRNIISAILGGGTPGRVKPLAISNPHDFRQVSAIIDVDIVPETCRRVRLLKHGSDKPLGFYIRDGTSVKVHGPAVHFTLTTCSMNVIFSGDAERSGEDTWHIHFSISARRIGRVDRLVGGQR